MKYSWIIILLYAVLFFNASCSKADDPLPAPPPTTEQPEDPEDSPQQPEIETTEEGSSRAILWGYLDNITGEGILHPQGYPNEIYIKDKKLQGDAYTFVQTEASKLSDMPAHETMSYWRATAPISQGTTYWACHTTSDQYRYLKIRIAYIDNNQVGIEYKDIETQKRPTIEDITQTENGSSVYLFNKENEKKGLTITDIPTPLLKKGEKLYGINYSFAQCTDISSLSEMPQAETMTQWVQEVTINSGDIFWISYNLPQQCTYIKLRIAFIDGEQVGIEYKVSHRTTVANENANSPIEGKLFVTDYSMPHLNPANYYVEHTVSYNNQEILNYAYEWVDSKKHTEWVAFSFDDITSQDNYNRPSQEDEPWAVDPNLPAEMQTSNDQHKLDGFDRGHLCASNDRVFSKDANAQTFFFSNMSPQINSFNGGYWIAFEQLVQNWARSNTYSHMYVTKGGTLNQLLKNFKGNKADSNGIYPETDENGFTIHGLACPQYYFMAILAQKGEEYQAIGFWVEHKEYDYSINNQPDAATIKTHAVSIDELEQQTGLDFFCNLPDIIENQVESSFNEADWAF